MNTKKISLGPTYSIIKKYTLKKIKSAPAKLKNDNIVIYNRKTKKKFTITDTNMDTKPKKKFTITDTNKDTKPKKKFTITDTNKDTKPKKKFTITD